MMKGSIMRYLLFLASTVVLFSCKSSTPSGLSFEEYIREEIQNHNLTPELLCPDILRFYVFNAEPTFTTDQIQFAPGYNEQEKMIKDVQAGNTFFHNSMKKQFDLAKSYLIDLSPQKDNTTIYHQGCHGRDVWSHHLLVFDGAGHGDSQALMSSTLYKFQSNPVTESTDLMTHAKAFANHSRELDLTVDMPLLLHAALEWVATKKAKVTQIEFVYSGHGGELRLEENANVNPFLISIEDSASGSVIFDAHGPKGTLKQNGALAARYLNELLPKICANDAYAKKSSICIEFQSQLHNPQQIAKADGITAGTSPQDVTSGTIPQVITSGTSPQDVTSGTTPQDITSGTTPQDITSGTTPQDITSGTTPQDWVSGGGPPMYTNGGKSFHIPTTPKVQINFSENPVMLNGSSKMGTYMPKVLPQIQSSFDFDAVLNNTPIQKVFSFLNSCNHHKDNHTAIFTTTPIKMSYWTPSPIYTWAVDFGALSDFEMRAYLGIQFTRRMQTQESLVDAFEHNFANNADLVRTNIPKDAVLPSIKDEYIKVIVNIKTPQ
jgi:hypothetical protein